MFKNSTRGLTQCSDLQTSKTVTVVKKLGLSAIYFIILRI